MNAFTRHAFASAIAAAALVASSAGTASAQTIGTFPFRLQPFCNNALLTVTQEGNSAIFDGALVFKRADHGIGDGIWADFGTVANEVQIKFRIVASAAK